MDSRSTDERSLDLREGEVLGRIFGFAKFNGSAALGAQVPFARVIGGKPTFLRLAVDPRAPRSECPDGPIPVRIFVADPQEGTYRGELLVWIKHGYLSAIEYAWVTEDTPSGLPEPESLTFE